VGIGFPRGKNLQRVRIVNHPQGIFFPQIPPLPDAGGFSNFNRMQFGRTMMSIDTRTPPLWLGLDAMTT
jgi:hypothetical protein